MSALTLSRAVWHNLVGGEKTETLGADNAFEEGERALAGGARRASFMVFVLF